MNNILYLDGFIKYNYRVSNVELIKYAEIGDLENLRSAIAAAADINWQEPDYGFTALHAAVARGHLDCVKLLLSQPLIDIDVQDRFGRTAADIANELPYTAIIDALIQHIEKHLEDCSPQPL